jgi:hypothetical protein
MGFGLKAPSLSTKKGGYHKGQTKLKEFIKLRSNLTLTPSESKAKLEPNLHMPLNLQGFWNGGDASVKHWILSCVLPDDAD